MHKNFNKEKEKYTKIESKFLLFINKNLERIKYLIYSKEEIDNLKKIFINDFIKKEKITIDKIQKLINEIKYD